LPLKIPPGAASIVSRFAEANCAQVVVPTLRIREQSVGGNGKCARYRYAAIFNFQAARGNSDEMFSGGTKILRREMQLLLFSNDKFAPVDLLATAIGSSLARSVSEGIPLLTLRVSCVVCGM
jgi:hypothetical protein